MQRAYFPSGFLREIDDHVFHYSANAFNAGALPSRTFHVVVKSSDVFVCAALPKERFVSADCVLRALPELTELGTDGTAELYSLPGAQGTVGLIRAMSHSFCARCNRLRLTADGKLKPCLHSSQEIPVRGLRGQALREAILQAAAAKPKRHLLNEQGVSGTDRAMHQIGG